MTDVVRPDPAAAEARGVEPAAVVPARDVRRVEEALAVEGRDPRPRLRVHPAPAGTVHPGDLDDRRLHHPRARVQGRVTQDRPDDRLHGEARAPVEADERRHRRGRRGRGDEVAPELPDEEGGMHRVADAQAAGVLPVVVAALAEDDLRAGVVAARVVAEVHVADGLLPVDAPAGQRPGLLADVVLGVAPARAEREELHQLARVVLVGRPLRVLDPVQPQEHGGILRDREQEPLEGAERAPAEERVLVEHELLRADAGVRGREPVVPDERHPLDQLPVRPDHAVEPPEVVVAPRVLRRERVAVVVGRRRADEPGLGRVQEVVDRSAQALPGDSGRLARLRAEAGAPEQPFGLRLTERAVVHGHAAGHEISIGGPSGSGDPFSCTRAV